MQSSRSEFFQQQELGEVVELAFVGDSENRAKPFEIDVRGVNFMTHRNAQAASFLQCRVRMLADDFEKRLLCRLRLTIDEIHDGSEMFSNDAGVRFGDEVPHCRRMPVIAAGEAAGIIQSLLNNGPFTISGHDERMKINLKTVGDRVVVDACGQTAGANKCLSIESAAI